MLLRLILIGLKNYNLITLPNFLTLYNCKNVLILQGKKSLDSQKLFIKDVIHGKTKNLSVILLFTKIREHRIKNGAALVLYLRGVILSRKKEA